MARNKDKNKRGYTLPALGIGGFGVPALALHGLDRELTRAGLDRNIQISRKAIDNLANYTNLRLNDVVDPSAFLPEYVARANKAVNSKAFNDVRVADILNNSIISRFPKNLAENWKTLDKLGPLGKGLRETISGLGYSLPDVYSAASEAAEGATGAELAKARLDKGLASHIPGVSGSYQDAYLRLLSEMAGVSVDRHNHPLFSGRGKAKQLADDLYEAVVNHTKPTRDGITKPFSSASEYIDVLWNNTKREGGLHAVPGAYRQATDIATDVVRRTGSKEKALEELTKLLGGPHLFYNHLKDTLGSPATYGLVDRNGIKILGKIKDSVGKGVVTSKAEALARGRTDLATSIFHGDAARLFSGSVMHHSGDATKAKIFNVLQKSRNPYLRAALGVGALGSAGLLANNIIKNRKKEKTWIGKIKDLFSNG